MPLIDPAKIRRHKPDPRRLIQSRAKMRERQKQSEANRAFRAYLLEQTAKMRNRQAHQVIEVPEARGAFVRHVVTVGQGRIKGVTIQESADGHTWTSDNPTTWQRIRRWFGA